MTNASTLLLPSLRSCIGDWVYYVATMTFSQVVERIKVGEEVYGKRELRDMLQRALTARSEEIADYLKREKQRFFNAIVAAIYGGEPEWYPVDLKGNIEVPTKELPEAVRQGFGVLSLSGEESIFALDGQHRLKGIERALSQRASLKNEELTVIFVGHLDTKAGKERTRRLFSTLNRYAKPVTLGEIIILDEDDAMAIVTRRLLEKHPLLSRDEAIYIGKTKVVPRSNKDCITSIQTLYEVLSILFFPLTKDGRKDLNTAKRMRPSNSELDHYYGEAEDFWGRLEKYFAPLQEISRADDLSGIAGKYRGQSGGHLLFRPVGLLAIARSVRRAKDAGISMDRFIRAISKLPLELSNNPWAGLLWNSQTNRMLTAKRKQDTASLLLLHLIGLDLRDFGSSLDTLRTEYASELNRAASEVRLPHRRNLL